MSALEILAVSKMCRDFRVTVISTEDTIKGKHGASGVYNSLTVAIEAMGCLYLASQAALGATQS